MIKLEQLKNTTPYTIKSYSKNEVLYHEGDEIDSVGIVLEGLLDISSSTIDGFSFEIHQVNEGDMFGDNLIILGKHTLLGKIEAIRESKVLFISSEDFKKCLLNNNEFLKEYLKITALRNVDNQYRIKLLSQPSIREKILFYLKEEIRKNHSKIVKLSITKEKLAELLSTNRPSLSRELMRMKKDGLITYSKKEIIYIK